MHFIAEKPLVNSITSRTLSTNHATLILKQLSKTRP